MQKANFVQSAIATGKGSFMPAIIAAAVLGGAAIAVYRAMDPQPPQAAFSQIQPVAAVEGAKLVIDREEAELGAMSVIDIRSADFRLKNTGSQPVEISQVRTSCMCTFAEIDTPGGKSPEFNMAMHNDATVNAWKGLVKPGEEAIVTVTYNPTLMPVEGSVARNVKFATNDPQNPVVELGVHATVEGGASNQ